MILLVSRMNNEHVSIKMDWTEMTKLNPTSLFDICLWTISVHKHRRTKPTANREIHKWPSNIPNNSSTNEELLHQFCQQESLEDTLMKISVKMFTNHHELQLITMTNIGISYRCGIVSHYKALYYYRQGEYMKLLNTCDAIISREIFTLTGRRHPKFSNHRAQDVFHVPVLFDFQTLFKNNVTCLTGLMELSFSVLGKDTVVCTVCLQCSQRRLVEVARVSCLFLVYFLRFQSLHKLHFPKRDILSALDDLKHASAGLVFEDILLLFVVKTLVRLQRWICSRRRIQSSSWIHNAWSIIIICSRFCISLEHTFKVKCCYSIHISVGPGTIIHLVFKMVIGN